MVTKWQMQRKRVGERERLPVEQENMQGEEGERNFFFFPSSESYFLFIIALGWFPGLAASFPEMRVIVTVWSTHVSYATEIIVSGPNE